MSTSINATATNKSKYMWNTLGSLSSALSSLVLAIIVNRVIGSDAGGVFAFAYSNAQLMYTIAAFEVRPFQSTDIEEKYKFSTYIWLRIITCAIMILISVLYVITHRYSYEKNIALLSLAGYRVMDAVNDLFGGRFQQKDRIDLSGKTLFIRIVVSNVAFIVSLVLFRKLSVACIVLFISSVITFFFDEVLFFFEEDKKELVSRKHLELSGLVKDVLPLFLGSFIMIYISNAPKYAINVFFDDTIQNVYNILFMPAFVINLFSIFIFRPLLVTMAEYRQKGEYRKLFSVIMRMYGIIGFITLAALAGAALLGIPVLSWAYGIDLTAYKRQLLYVMCCGGLSAIMTFSYYAITVLRKQRCLLYGYGMAFLESLIVTKWLVKAHSIDGAIVAYGLSVGIIVIVFTAVIIWYLTRVGFITKRKNH